jgi:adenylate kinase
MIITISGSVGSGKTTIAKTLSEKLDYKLINLNELAKKYKIEDIKELQTFDFDLDKLLEDLELDLKNKKFGNNVVLEGHFSHFINPELIDKLIVIGRDLKQLKQTYKDRKYNEQKIADNLEVESFNLCFYEAIDEGYTQGKQVFLVENNGTLQDCIDKIKVLLI